MWPNAGCPDNDSENLPELFITEGTKFVKVPIERQTYTSSHGLIFTESIVAKADQQISWVNPYRDRIYPFTETMQDGRMPMSPEDMAQWQTSDATTLHSIALDLLGQGQAVYTSHEGCADLELIIASHLSSEKGNALVPLPVKELSRYEKNIHEEYFRAFGHDILEHPQEKRC